MVPTLILVGFFAGLMPRGWLAIPIAAVGWSALLLAGGVESGLTFALFAVLVGGLNTAVGVSVGAGIGSLAYYLSALTTPASQRR